jgi:hypothetical protein
MSRRTTPLRLFGTAMAWSAILTASLSAQQQSSPDPPSKTQVVLLGTGNPFPDPDRSGPATAIVGSLDRVRSRDPNRSDGVPFVLFHVSTRRLPQFRCDGVRCFSHVRD